MGWVWNTPVNGLVATRPYKKGTLLYGSFTNRRLPCVMSSIRLLPALRKQRIRLFLLLPLRKDDGLLKLSRCHILQP